MIQILWFCLVAVIIAGYVVLDGFDLGAGAIHLLVARRRRSASGFCAPSAQYGRATKCGCWPPAVRSTSLFPRSTLPASADSICP